MDCTQASKGSAKYSTLLWLIFSSSNRCLYWGGEETCNLNPKIFEASIQDAHILFISPIQEIVFPRISLSLFLKGENIGKDLAWMMFIS